MLARLKDIALSNSDIIKLLDGKTSIVLYPDLHKYSSIDELLGEYQNCIVLYESRKGYGHWTAMIKKGDAIEFFNSYGGEVDASLELINPEFRVKSNQVEPYLKMLMYDSPYELNYNEFRFQKKGRNIRTCGRHCIVRVLCRDMNIYQYKDFLDQLCDLFGTDYDGIVTILTS
jgi:hypothetical protein